MLSLIHISLALSSTEEAEKAAPKGQMEPVVVLKDGNGDGVVNVLVHDGTGTCLLYTSRCV